MAYVRLCKYECKTQLKDFDEKENKYKEYPSGIVHTKERCTEAKRKLQNQPQPQQQRQQQQNQYQVDQDQKSKDIKDAQKQRKQEHDELMTELRNLRKAIVAEIASRKDAETQDVIDSIGFEESRQEYHDFQDEVV